MEAKCVDPECISRVEDKLDNDARLMLLPCSHALCARCLRRRTRLTGSAECPDAGCRAPFRATEAVDADDADAEAMRREAQVRKRVLAVFPKSLGDFVEEAHGDEAAARRLFDAYSEQAETFVARLLDRTPVHGSGSVTVAELAAKELRALETQDRRGIALASAKRRREHAQAGAMISAEQEAMLQVTRAQQLAEANLSEESRRKRLRETLTAIDGTALPTAGDDAKVPPPPVAMDSMSTSLPGAGHALAGVTAATASSARMRRPALPHVPLPKLLDREEAPPSMQDAREAPAEAMTAVESVLRGVQEFQAAVAVGSIDCHPLPKSGPASALVPALKAWRRRGGVQL
jgi:hypothetical protein